jgi:diguanylate cyclase (GGDEF)-like protein
MQTSFELKHRLGYRILRWVLSVALISGILLSTLQIILDARHVSEELDQQAEQTMALVRDAATQAVFSIDHELAQQVVDGLFQQQAIHFAEIAHPDGEALAKSDRPLVSAPYRSLTDAIFSPERIYEIDLSRDVESDTSYGVLTVHFDTAYTAKTWLERATLTFASGILRAVILALVLYFVYHLLLTRPMLRIVNSLTRVNPDHPDDRLLGIPPGHERDELGLWVNATNNLLVAISENQKMQREAEARAKNLSRYDHLTGLPGRETFLGILANAITETGRGGRQLLSVFCCGIDDFKGINEQFGYQAGDRVLQVLAERLSSNKNQVYALAGRLGSDQFVLLGQNLRDGYQAAATAETLLQNISRPIDFGGHTVSVSATVGIALFPADSSHADQLLQRAEQAMTLAKASGRNHFQFYVASVDQQIRERKKLEKDLSLALTNGEFHLVYQPQINLENRMIIGAEALLRWNHPERGLIPPDEFIPLAELNGTIVEIGAWVLDQACRQAAVWMKKDLSLRIAVNLSAVQLKHNNIVDMILATLRQHNIPPGRLELEVTETSFMDNLEDAVSKLNELRNAGISLAVDDFGTGYSSLTYLKRMPIQHIKIDKQFVRDLLVHEEDTRIANTIIDLGKSLNLSVVAEGVETEEQEVYLRERGCQLAQGFYFSKPLVPEKFESFVAEFGKNTVKTY